MQYAMAVGYVWYVVGSGVQYKYVRRVCSVKGRVIRETRGVCCLSKLNAYPNSLRRAFILSWEFLFLNITPFQMFTAFEKATKLKD